MSYDHIFRASVTREGDRIVTRWFSCDSSVHPWPTLAEAMQEPLQEIRGLCFPTDVDPEVIAVQVEKLARDYDSLSLREARVRNGPAGYEVWRRRFAAAGVKLRPARWSRIVYNPSEELIRGVSSQAALAAGTPLSDIPGREASSLEHARVTMATGYSHPFMGVKHALYIAWIRSDAAERITTVAISNHPTGKCGIPTPAHHVLLAASRPESSGRSHLKGTTLNDAISIAGPKLVGMRVLLHVQPNSQLHSLGAQHSFRVLPRANDPIDYWNPCLTLYSVSEAAELCRRAEELDPTMILVDLEAREFLAEYASLLPAAFAPTESQLGS